MSEGNEFGVISKEAAGSLSREFFVQNIGDTMVRAVQNGTAPKEQADAFLEKLTKDPETIKAHIKEVYRPTTFQLLKQNPVAVVDINLTNVPDDRVEKADIVIIHSDSEQFLKPLSDEETGGVFDYIKSQLLP